LPWSEYLDGLFHHPVVKNTNTKNGRTKMHAKLLCQMDRLLTELKGCVNMLNFDMKSIWNMML
jgi:hypothetical protein